MLTTSYAELFLIGCEMTIGNREDINVLTQGECKGYKGERR